ncbi:FkbM family methyltransferase [Sphingobium sp. CR28]|uniref:FkbM family methyltransferase n=1 Tax=Sphingobium sp. CR28 TaxID=3400272 RepID=UPI003FEF54F6
MWGAIKSVVIGAMERIAPRLLAAMRVRRARAGTEPELGFLPFLADASGTFVDVGANNGVYSYAAMRSFGHVVAIEAHPDLTAPLRRILGHRGTVLPVALSDAPGEATLWVPRHGHMDVTTRSSLDQQANPGFALRPVQVAVTTLDALAIERPAVIKIDVEGHEFSVLSGAVETLKRYRPVCIVEVEERHNAGGVARAFAFFAGLGYEAWYLHRGRLMPGAGFDVVRLQSSDGAKTFEGAQSRDYVNNFLFVHPDNAEGLARIRAAYC